MKKFLIIFFVTIELLLVLGGGPKVTEAPITLPPSFLEETTEGPTEAPAPITLPPSFPEETTEGPTETPETEAPAVETTTPMAPPTCSFTTTIGNKAVCAVREGLTGEDATRRCQALSGKLFLIESEEEKNQLQQWLNNYWERIDGGLIYRINGLRSGGEWLTYEGEKLPSAAYFEDYRDNGNCLVISVDSSYGQFFVAGNDCESGWSYICQIPATAEPETEAPATTLPPKIAECAYQLTFSNKIACAVHRGAPASEASNTCQSLAGKLFVIETEEEKNALNQWLYNVWGGATGLVYRINGFKESGQWVTDDGVQLSMISIPPESPDNGNCLQFEGDGATQTFYVKTSDCEAGWSFICQIPY